MAKAIFHREFQYTSRKRNAGWSVRASDKPQTLPRELIDAGVAAGVAEIVEPKRRGNTAKGPDHSAD